MKLLFLTLFTTVCIHFTQAQSNDSTTKMDTTIGFQVTKCKKDTNVIFIDSIRYLSNSDEQLRHETTYLDTNLRTPRPDGTKYFVESIVISNPIYENQIPIIGIAFISTTINTKDIRLQSLAVREINEIASLTAGVQLTSKGLSFKGSREDGTAYYLDGMRMIEPLQVCNNELAILQK